jgi:hypothetical protein
METIHNFCAIGPEVEFSEGFVTEDYWNQLQSDVIGFIRYYDCGKTEYVLTGRK